MSELDLHLTALAHEAPPPALADIDGAVMQGLARHRERQASRRGLALAGVVAVLVGVGGTLYPAPPAEAAPLFGVPTSAPSHLLGE